MKNSKRIFAALLAATMIFTSMGNDIIFHVNAAETEGSEIPAGASETQGSEIPAEASEEALAAEAGMEMKQPKPEKTKERSEQDDAASEEDVSKERTEETTESTDAVQEYIVVAKNKRAYERTEDEYGNLEEGTEKEGEDGQLLEENNILVAEMTGEEAEELEEKRDILLVEENITFERSGFEEDTGLSDEKDGYGSMEKTWRIIGSILRKRMGMWKMRRII